MQAWGLAGQFTVAVRNRAAPEQGLAPEGAAEGQARPETRAASSACPWCARASASPTRPGRGLSDGDEEPDGGTTPPSTRGPRAPAAGGWGQRALLPRPAPSPALAAAPPLRQGTGQGPSRF